jgi:hypothetical protein
MSKNYFLLILQNINKYAKLCFCFAKLAKNNFCSFCKPKINLPKIVLEFSKMSKKLAHNYEDKAFFGEIEKWLFFSILEMKSHFSIGSI